MDLVLKWKATWQLCWGRDSIVIIQVCKAEVFEMILISGNCHKMVCYFVVTLGKKTQYGLC